MNVRRLLLVLCLFGVLILIVRFSLQFIPAFVIREIRVTENPAGYSIPASAVRVMQSWNGKNAFSFTRAEMERALSSDPLILKAQVRRRGAGVVAVSLRIREADAVILCTKEGQVVDSLVVTDTGILPLAEDERDVYPERVVRVEVSDSYGQMMRHYGVDDAFRSVLAMVGSISGDTSLITTVKYDNNSSNSFGNVVLVLEPLNALVSVREKIDASRLSQALEVVKREQVGSIPSREPTCYDVYGSGMVRR